MPSHRCSASAAFICEVPSQSEHGKSYTVRRGLDNHGYQDEALAWSCSCPDWEFRKNTDRPYRCKHIREVQEYPGQHGFCDWEGVATPTLRCPSCSAPILPERCFRSLPPLTVVEPTPNLRATHVASTPPPAPQVNPLPIHQNPNPMHLMMPKVVPLAAGREFALAQWEKVPDEFAGLVGHCLFRRIGNTNNQEQVGYDLLWCFEGDAALNIDRLVQLERMFKTRGRLVGFSRTLSEQLRPNEPPRAMIAVTL